jgi:hypothetical protein
MSRLAELNLIPNFELVKGLKCQAYVQSKESHKAAEARNLATLELIHTDLSEMNGVLTKVAKDIL